MKWYRVFLKLENASDALITDLRAAKIRTHEDLNNIRWLEFYDLDDYIVGCFREDMVIGYSRLEIYGGNDGVKKNEQD